MKNRSILQIILLAALIINSSIVKGEAHEKSWELGFSTQGIKVLYNIEKLNDKSVIYITFINNNSCTAELLWDETIGFMQNNVVCMVDSSKQKFIIHPTANNDKNKIRTITYVLASEILSSESCFDDIMHMAFKNVVVNLGVV